MRLCALVIFILTLTYVSSKDLEDKCPIKKREIDRDTVEKCAEYGRTSGNELCRREKVLQKSGMVVKRGTPEFVHFMNTRGTSKIELYHLSLGVIQATKKYRDSLGFGYDKTPNTFIEYLLHQGFIAGPYQVCAPPVSCSGFSERYRTIDGSCNNRMFPRWGQALTAYNRLLPPAYSDGVHAIRKSVTGGPLPLTRGVSGTMFDDRHNPDDLWTVMFMQFGQFVSHDMSLAPAVNYGDEGIQCCTPDGSSIVPPHLLHHACLPILIPDNDPFYSQWNQRCMNFVRSMTVAHPDCRLGPAEQMNSVSHWLDLSQVYGSSDEEARSLRLFRNGLLAYEFHHGHVVLPFDHKGCVSGCPASACYKAGDTRVNQNNGLAAIHAMYMREHNRIATELHNINPHWDDEVLYQEARRISIAIYQHIVYNEYLPIALGMDYCIQHNLLSPPEGTVGGPAGYNDQISPNILNEHATAAYRYQHSTIHGHSELFGEGHVFNGTLRMSDHYNCPAFLEDTPFNYDWYVRGMCTSPMQSADPFYTHEITHYLFRNGKPFGLDLESLDLQRGRDHGLKPYNEYRALCGLPRAMSFEDLLDVMSPDTVQRLSQLYAHVDDIDIAMAFMERHFEGAQFGPTLQCIVGEQFYRTRVSDRFFYSHRGMPTSFTDAQLQEIQRVSLAKFVCTNAYFMREIQPSIFRLISEQNHLMPCGALPGLDLSPWRDLSTGGF